MLTLDIVIIVLYIPYLFPYYDIPLCKSMYQKYKVEIISTDNAYIIEIKK